MAIIILLGDIVQHFEKRFQQIPELNCKERYKKAPVLHSGENSEYEQRLNKTCKCLTHSLFKIV